MDDNPSALDGVYYDVPILSAIGHYAPKVDEQLVVAIGNPANRRRIVDLLRTRNARFYTLIHPTSLIGENVEVGEGCVIGPYCVLTCDIRLGEFVFVNVTSNIGHDVTIGDFTSVNSNVDLTGGVRVGEECFFGVGATVVPGRRIEAGAKVGAGSVVVDHVPAGVTVFGNPARPLSTTQFRDSQAKACQVGGTDQNEDLERDLIEWVQEHNQASEEEFVVEADTNLIEAAILDSVGFIELIAFLEKGTGVNIDLTDHRPEDIATIGGLCRCVSNPKQLAPTAPAAPGTIIRSYSDGAAEYDGEANQQSCWGLATFESLSKIQIQSRYKSILDVGCGTGRALHELASQSSREVQFLGIEPAEEMRKMAQDRLRRFKNVSISDGRFEDLPVPSNSVDYLYSTFAFHWATDLDRSLLLLLGVRPCLLLLLLGVRLGRAKFALAG